MCGTRRVRRPTPRQLATDTISWPATVRATDRPADVGALADDVPPAGVLPGHRKESAIRLGLASRQDAGIGFARGCGTREIGTRDRTFSGSRPIRPFSSLSHRR